MKKKNKGGRPKKGLAEKLKYPVKFMLSTGDYYTLKARAESAGLKLAEFARLAAIGCQITPHRTPEEAGWIRKLSGMGNNLNQLTVLAHRAGYAEATVENRQLAGQISEALKNLRNDGQDNKR